MKETSLRRSATLLLLILAVVEAIHDPAYTGIKKRSYQRDPLIAQAFEQHQQQQQQQQQQQESYNPYYQERHGHYAGLSTTTTNSQIHNTNSNARIQDQVQPIYERPSTSSNAWHDSENAITEYYTGCPPQHTGVLPYAYDCRRFVNCFKGRAHIQSCGPGTVFNPQTLECDRPDKVLCGANAALGSQQKPQQRRTERLLSVEPRCTPGLTGLQPHPTDCTKFLNCANGQTYIQDCSPGTAYSITQMGCDYKHKVDCGDREFGVVSVTPTYVNSVANTTSRTTTSTQSVISCPPGVYGLYAHPYDRRKYLNCVHNSHTIENCAPGTTFDSVNLVCVFTAQDSNYAYTQNNQNLLSSEKHDADILCPSGIMGLFAHPFDYTKFFNCKSGKIAVQTCIKDFVFSISKGYCEPKDQLIYTDYVQYIVSEVSYEYTLMLTNCPPGTDGHHFYPYDASKYIRCLAGKMSIINCGENLAYSISNKACRPTKFINRNDRVKFHREILQTFDISISSNTYGETQAFQSTLTQCPRGTTGLYPYSFHYTKYVLCQNGLLQIETCASGKVFSLSKKQCVLRADLAEHDLIWLQSYSSTFSSSSSAFAETYNIRLPNVATTVNYMEDLTAITCPPNAQGLYLHPFDCTKYLNCHDQQTLIESCATGSVYSISKRQCITTDQVEAYDRVEYLSGAQHEFFDESRQFSVKETTNSEQVTCAPGATGLQPHPHDCTRFLNCANGQTFIQNCGPGTAWSIEHEVCDFLHNVDCSTRSGGGIVGTQSANGQGQHIKCPENVYGLYAHPFDSRKFLRCEAGFTNVQNCCQNNVFSISRSFCLPQQQVAANDRVVNYQLSTELTINFDYLVCPKDYSGAYLYPFDCTKYINCEANGLTELKLCPADTHFSISHGACLSSAEVARADRVHSLLELQNYYNWMQQYYENQESSGDNMRCPAGMIGLYQHPYDATKFLSCSQTAVQVYECPPQRVFSVSRRLCLQQQEVPEIDRCTYKGSFTAQREGKNLEATQTTKDGNEIACPLGATGLQPHPHDCSKYLNCANGQTYIQACGPGTAWDKALEVCDFLTKVDCSGREDNREPKSSLGSYATTTTDQSVYNDRWSNMNMNRPAGIGYGAQSHVPYGGSTTPSTTAGWSGHGTSVDHSSPTQSVLYVSGSLVPNRKYQQSFHTPLAPLLPQTQTDDTTTTTTTTTTANVYYAQPINSAEDTSYEPIPNWQRQNHSREINYGPAATNGWRPHYPSTHAQYPNSPNYPSTPNLPNAQYIPPYANNDLGQRPLEETATYPHRTVTKINLDNLPKDRQFVLSEYPDQTSSGSDYSPKRLRPDASNLYGGLQPPQTENNHNKPNVTYNPYLNHRTTYREPQIPTYLQKNPTPIPNLTTPSNVLQEPVKSTTPQSNVRTYQIYPPIANTTAPKNPQQPHYSPSYSGVAHSHNATWLDRKLPVDTQRADRQEPINSQEELETQFEYDEDDVIDGFKTKQLAGSTTTERRGYAPPPFNHEFYSTPKTTTQKNSNDETAELPLSEAIRMLLKPYFNRSGTVEDSDALRAESHIMSIVNQQKPTTTDTTTTTTSTSTSTPKSGLKTTTTTTETQQSEDDFELIFAGEQENLRTTVTIPTAAGDNRHDTRTDFHLNHGNPNGHNNWQHSRDYHERNPNLPNPFNDGASSHHQHHNHPHHNHHNPEHQHNRDFHQRHPNLPNPFERQQPEAEADESTGDDGEQLPHNKAEFTTPRNEYNFRRIDVRNGFDAETGVKTCEYDCGDGQCLKENEVCDGVKNCANAKDESQCEHLGYEVRLTGGDATNMGRIEVKVLGKWAYVCDDKFGLRDADVVCKELGFKLGASEVRGNSYYPPTELNFSYAMDEVECRGNETKLKDCSFKGWGVHNCGPDEVVGVVCKVPLLKCPNNYWLCSTSKECIPPAFVCDNTEDCADKSDESAAVCNSPIEYRLEGGRSANEGRLEIRYRGEWGTICDDDFSMKEAQVACNSMGYYGKPQIEKNIYGLSHGPIWLDQVSCFGNETSLDKCHHWAWGEHNCNHTEDVGLRCTAGPPPRRTTALDNNNNNNQEQQQQQTQNAMEDIGLYAGQSERSSKFLTNQRRCGHFKDDLVDEYAYPGQRVVNGTIAKRGRHPWQATIRTRGRGGISSHWCGAVLISKRHLLTAAHCLAGYAKGGYFVRLGDHYATIAEASETDSYIENWYIHEKFRDKTHMNNDIALVVLKTPVRFNDYVQPICLPEKGTALVDNRMCTISGWGSIKSGVSTPSNVLRSAQLPILPDSVCKESHVYGDAITEGMFCAGSMDESVDACDGDSGGPLVCSDDDGETLHGIISWGQHCGYINKPGVYVRVEKYIDWIYEKINISMQQPGQ